MAVSLDLDIEIELVLSASGQFYDFIQRGDLRPGEGFVKKSPVVQVLDLVIGHFPDILVHPRCPLEIVVVHHDDRAVLKHLHIQLRRRKSLIDALLKSRHRVLGRRSGKAPVRHDHGSAVIRVEYPPNLGKPFGHREKDADRAYCKNQILKDRIAVKIVRRIRVLQDRLPQLLLPLIVGVLKACHHKRDHDP